MPMIKEMSELQRLGVIKVQDGYLTHDPCYSFNDFMQVSLLLT